MKVFVVFQSWANYEASGDILLNIFDTKEKLKIIF